ncbi:MAG: 30S ribosomal protein S4 [Chloroflexi bacterium 13_1_40CM_4_68_4]|nr:MAG: 30S ribosomal protein S4 [Chloroflexi bacterium 13_1_40CM_4_68_4]
MARYSGPVCRICRREAMKLFLKGEKCLTKCTLERRATPPGMHQQRRRKVSDYALQLREKQKARRYYGVLERQMSKYFEAAARRTGVTGEALLQRLESRLDNVIYRAGFAKSRPQARQLVGHGHIQVNGRRTDIPSMGVRAGDVLTVRESSRTDPLFKDLQTWAKSQSVPRWLQTDPDALEIRVVQLPTRDQIETQVNEQLIVEHYSR